MANATFYKISKRHNSTLQPSGSGTVIDVQLKNGSDIIAPVFLLSLASLPDYSMMVFEGRTYFITGISSVRDNLWEISAEVDVLATYKTNILATTAFIEYSTNGNTNIIDSRLAITTPKLFDYVDTPLSDFVSTTGTYLLTVCGAAPAGGQGTTHTPGTQGSRTYALSAGTLANVFASAKDYIDNIGSADTDTFGAVKSLARNLVGIGDINSTIKGCTWVPWNISAMGDVTLDWIWLGIFDTGLSGYSIDVPIKNYETSISIPWHFTDWRRNSPYTQIYLYIPFVGLVQLSSENLIGESVVYVRVAINRINGNCNFEVRAGNQIIGTYSASTGVGIPVGASGLSGETAAIGAIAHVGSMALGGAAGAVAGAVAQISQIAPNTITAGNLSGGASAGLDLNLRCYTVSHGVSGTALGVPVFNMNVIPNSGYVKTRDASVSGSMTDTERSRINMLLDGGVYIE